MLNSIMKNTFNILKGQNVVKLLYCPFSTTPQRNIKEIQESRVGDCIQFEGITKESSRSPKLLSEVVNNERFCPECTLGLDIKHTDVLILSQYVRSDGCMLPRRITGLCRRQQKKMGTLVTMAQKAGLMPNLTPDKCKKDPKKRYGWKKFNKYYDERTIRLNRY